jgi:hypothetical protein
MKANEAKRLRELESENAKLKKLGLRRPPTCKRKRTRPPRGGPLLRAERPRRRPVGQQAPKQRHATGQHPILPGVRDLRVVGARRQRRLERRQPTPDVGVVALQGTLHRVAALGAHDDSAKCEREGGPHVS